MKSSTVLLAAMFIASCDATPVHGASVETEQTADAEGISTSLGAIGRIRTGMTEADLARLGYKFTRSEIVLEGDTYTSIRLALDNEKYVECLMLSGVVDSISTKAVGISDENGIGVGSTLAHVREAYPNGRLLIGDEDGRYANFVNGTKVVFQIDQRALESACFEPRSDSCEVDPETRVVGVVVNSGPAGRQVES